MCSTCLINLVFTKSKFFNAATILLYKIGIRLRLTESVTLPGDPARLCTIAVGYQNIFTCIHGNLQTIIGLHILLVL